MKSAAMGDLHLAIREAEKLEHFLASLLEHTDLCSTVVIVCSDHGNMEDISVITHTLNPVPTIVWGDIPHNIIDSIGSLTDVTPGILRCLQL